MFVSIFCYADGRSGARGSTRVRFATVGFPDFCHEKYWVGFDCLEEREIRVGFECGSEEYGGGVLNS